MYERRIGEPAGNRSLEQLGPAPRRTRHLPERPRRDFRASKELERIRNRTATKKVTKSESSCLLADIMTILKWYMTVEQPDKIGQKPTLTASQQPVIAMARAGPRIGENRAQRGLRSFDAKDADFFLDLLPGPARPRRSSRKHSVLETSDRRARKRQLSRWE